MLHVPVPTSIVTTPVVALTEHTEPVVVANATAPVPLPPEVPRSTVSWYVSVAGFPVIVKPVCCTIHCAYRVKLDVRPCTHGNEMALPPDAAVNQPLKPALARVGVPGDAAIEPPVMVVPSETALPPCESYVIVRVFAVHCAYRVKLAVWPCA